MGGIMASWQYLWAGIGITLLLLPLVQMFYCWGIRYPTDKDEEIEDVPNLKFSHWIIGVPIFVGFWLTLFLFVIPIIQGDF